MQDHGADAATVVANASVDIGKTMLQMSAKVITTIFLLARAGSRIKSGETNIDKLIKSMDAGDQITSAVIDPKHASEIAALSKQHQVVYAIIENQEGQMIVYFKESQADRMKHILDDILKGAVKEKNDGKEPEASDTSEGEQGDEEQEKASKSRKENSHVDPEGTVDHIVSGLEQMMKSVDDLFQDGITNPEMTTVIFNKENPMDFVEIFFDIEKVPQFAIYKDGQLLQMDGLPTEQQAREAASEYREHGSFQIKGASYKEKELLQMVGQVAEKQQVRREELQKQEEKAKFLGELEAQPAWMDGNLHIVTDADHQGNFIAIYKELESTESGIATKNTAKVFVDGIEQAGADPAKAFEQYQNYTHTETNGHSAGKSFELLQEQSKQKQKMIEAANELPLETHVMFDSGKADHFIELRQNEKGVELFSHEGNKVQPVSNEQANEQIKTYKEPMTIVAKGHYDHDTLYKKIDELATKQLEKQKLMEMAAAKEQKINDVLKETAGLDGTLHTFIDTKNTNNRIYIYKDIQQIDGQLQTVNQSLTFLDGERAKVNPVNALQHMEKYRHTEKSGKAVASQFEKLLQTDQMNWGKTKTKEDRDPDAVELRKPLAEYQEVITKTRTINPEKIVPEIKLGPAAKETAARGER